ncbi:TrmH family RNA methyltransferase [Candidatus Formimonas warabiya]|uniref:RNA 2-O ribose methyltransferase substrate binding domain-containing protein n=1 Tax=Formimonas warabiya TaxID=1761012 RepID=A0A3G1KN92_FORW1|nr:RNA methyltransferase [Candidatus Formimonas warabiya]ATW23927.1 hypothetical protein DCMF_03150 [Candidatus Formimonas warabiya]
MNNSDMIISKNNQYVKLAKSLMNRKYREKQNLFILEGVRLIEEAVAAGIKLEFILYCSRLCSSGRGARLLEKITELGVSTFLVEEKIFEDLADTENPQGIVAAAQMTKSRFADIKTKEDNLVMLIDGVQDPGNLGTMIRTACAAGVSGIILTKGTVDLFNPKVVRASMGTMFNIPVVSAVDDQEIVNYLKKNRFRLLIADVAGEKFYFDVDVDGPLVWGLGNEANGPRTFFMEQADEIVKIPLVGKAESLNVAVAAGILLYDTVRRRGVL